MVRRSIAGAVWIFLASLYASPAYAEQVLGPKMVINDLVFDCGEVKPGEIIEHTFSVLNRGDAPLEIVRVRPG